MTEVGRRLSQDPDALFRLRMQAGLTQGQLAERAGLSKGFVSKLESGKSSASAEALNRLAKALGRPVVALMPDEPLRRPA